MKPTKALKVIRASLKRERRVYVFDANMYRRGYPTLEGHHADRRLREIDEALEAMDDLISALQEYGNRDHYTATGALRWLDGEPDPAIGNACDHGHLARKVLGER